jgi:hypothetical protein
MTKPTGKVVSVSLSDVPETSDTYRSQQIAMVMEDGSAWVRHRSASTDWEWSEWSLVYAPE